tara:strand:+ start:63 stop:185 length:123 start_codon:yes stop_codon:yes gene_type:complete
MRTTFIALAAIMVAEASAIKMESSDVWTDMKDQIAESNNP